MSLKDALNRVNQEPVNAAGSNYITPFERYMQQNNLVNIQDYSTNKAINNVDLSGQNVIHYDPYQYNRYDIPVTPKSSIEELNRQRAINQSFGEQLWRFGVQTVGDQIALGTIQAFVDLGDALTGNQEGDYSNPLSAEIEEMRNALREANEIYRENPNESFDLSDSGWWLNGATSIVSSLALMAPGLAVTRGVGLLAKTINATKGVTKLLEGYNTIAKGAKLGALTVNSARRTEQLAQLGEIGSMALTSRIAENYQEARQTYNNSIEQVMNSLDNMSEKERDEFNKNNPEFAGKSNREIAEIIAGESSDDVFNDDMKLLLFDFFQLKGLNKVWKGFQGKGPLSKAVRDEERRFAAQISGKTYEPLTGFKGFLDDMKLVANPKTVITEATEGLEESWQYTSQKRAEENMLNRLDPKSQVRGYLDILTDEESLENAFWGWIGGITFQGLGGATMRGINAYQDAKYKKEHLEDAAGYNIRRQEGVMDAYRTAEIKSRISQIGRYHELRKLVDDGYDVYNYRTDENNNVITDQEGNVVYEELTDEYQGELIKKDLEDDMLVNLALNAYDRGNYKALKETVKATNLGEKDKTFADRAIAKMDETVDLYEKELGMAIANAPSENIARQIALDNVKAKLKVRNHEKLASDFTSHIEDLISINDYSGNEEDELRKGIRAMEIAYYKEMLDEIDSMIDDYNKQYKVNNKNRISRSTYLKKVRQLNRIKNIIYNRKPELREFENKRNNINTQIENLRKQLDDSNEQLTKAIAAGDLNLRQSITESMNTVSQTIDDLNAQLIEQEKLFNQTFKEASKTVLDINEDIYNNKYNELSFTSRALMDAGDILNTKQEIKEEATYMDNALKAFRDKEVKDANKTIKDIISNKDLDLNQIADELNGRQTSLPDEVKARLHEAIEKYNLYSYTNSSILDKISKELRKETFLRANQPEATKDGEVVTETPPTPPQSEQNEEQLKPPVEEVSQPAPAATSPTTITATETESNTPPTGGQTETPSVVVVDGEVINNDVQGEEMTNDDIIQVEQISGEYIDEYELGKSIRNDIRKALKGKNFDWYNRSYNDIFNEVKQQLINKYSKPDVEREMKDFDMVLFESMSDNGISFKDAYQNFDYFKNAFDSVDSRLVFETVEIANGDIANEQIRQLYVSLIERYVTENNIVTNSQRLYVNLDELIKYLIRNNITDRTILHKIYNNMKVFFNSRYNNGKTIYKLKYVPFNLSDNKLNKLFKEVEAGDDIGQDIFKRAIDPTADKRIHIIDRNLYLEAGTPVYALRDKTGNGVNFYIEQNGRMIQIGYNAVGRKSANGNGYKVSTRNIEYEIKHENGIYTSDLDIIFDTLFPYNENYENIPLSEDAGKALNAIFDLGYEMTRLKVNNSFNDSWLVNHRQQIEDLLACPVIRDFLANHYTIFNTNKEGAVSSFIQLIYPIIEFSKVSGLNSDINRNIITLYKDFIVRQISNYNFTDELNNQLKNMPNTSKNPAVITLNVTRSQRGEIIQEGELKPIDASTIVGFNLDKNDNTEGEVHLARIINKGQIKLDNGRIHTIPGFNRDLGSPLLLAVSNGSNYPDYIPVYATVINDIKDTPFGKDLLTEISNIFSNFQHNVIDFDTVYDRLKEIIGVNKLIQDISIYKTKDDKIIISYYKNVGNNRTADITIYKRNGKGEISTGISFTNPDGTVTSGINFAENTIKDFVNKLFSLGRIAMSYDYFEDVIIDTPYVKKNNKEMIVTLNGNEYKAKNYLEFISKYQTGKIQLGKMVINGKETNFNPRTTNQGANINIQVDYNERSGNQVDNRVQEEETNNVNNLLELLRTSNNNIKANQLLPERNTKALLSIFAPRYVNTFFNSNGTIKTIGSVGLLPTSFRIRAFNEQGEFIQYDPNNPNEEVDASYYEDGSYEVTTKLLTRINPNNESSQEEFIKTLLHERIHGLIASKAGKVNIEEIRDGINEVINKLYEFVDNVDNLTQYALSRNLNIDILRNNLNLLRDYINNLKRNGKDNVAVEEFIAYTLTNRTFIDLLNSIEDEVTDTGKKTLWDKFVDFIAKLFFGNDYKINQRSLLNKEIQLLAGNITRVKNEDIVSSPVEGVSNPSPTGDIAQEISPVNDKTSPTTAEEKEEENPTDNPDTDTYSADDLADLQNLDEIVGDDLKDILGDDYNDDYSDDGLDNFASELIFDDINVTNLSTIQQALRPDQRPEFDALANAGAIKLHC